MRYGKLHHWARDGLSHYVSVLKHTFVVLVEADLKLSKEVQEQLQQAAMEEYQYAVG